MIAADTTPVGIAYSAFAPAEVRVVSGDTVTWRNGSTRDHTVVGDDFASDRILPRGGFSHAFTTAGAHPYVCTLHLGMHGEVDVEPILIDEAPAVVAPGQPVVLSGRAQPGITQVTLERDTGQGFRPVGAAGVIHGEFHARVPAGPAGALRAVAGSLASPPVPVRVLGQRIGFRAVRARGRTVIRVTTLPARPRATVVLQLRLRERFGWWPVRNARLDRRGRTTLRVALTHAVSARVILTERDGATPLATSRPALIRSL